MLRFLLDEHIAPAVARGLSAGRLAPTAIALASWQDGSYLGASDDTVLRAAHTALLTLVTYDRRSIPTLLTQWAEGEIDHGGVIFVDTRTIPPNDIGGLVSALAELWNALNAADWTNRVVFLSRPGRM